MVLKMVARSRLFDNIISGCGSFGNSTEVGILETRWDRTGVAMKTVL